MTKAIDDALESIHEIEEELEVIANGDFRSSPLAQAALSHIQHHSVEEPTVTEPTPSASNETEQIAGVFDF